MRSLHAFCMNDHAFVECLVRRLEICSLLSSNISDGPTLHCDIFLSVSQVKFFVGVYNTSIWVRKITQILSHKCSTIKKCQIFNISNYIEKKFTFYFCDVAIHYIKSVLVPLTQICAKSKQIVS